MKRTAIARVTPLARTGALPAKRKGQRRVVHPFPLPTPGERITEADVRTELHAFGPQAELCRHTECAACFFVHWSRYPFRQRGDVIDWTKLTHHGLRVSDPHHEHEGRDGEPRGRGLKGEATDRDCYPLCRKHHTDGVGDTVRHRFRSEARDAAAFYSLLPFDWRAVVAEMRRRVANKSLTGSPPDKGAIEGSLSSAPTDRVVATTEPAQGGGAGNPSALGRASTEENTP